MMSSTCLFLNSLPDIIYLTPFFITFSVALGYSQSTDDISLTPFLIVSSSFDVKSNVVTL